MTQENIGLKKVTRSLTTDASGNAFADITINGSVQKIRATCTTSGAVVTLYGLEHEQGVNVTGDTIFTKIVSGTETARPTILTTSGSGTGATPNEFVHYVADQGKIVIASGGNTKYADVNIYIR